MLLGSTGNLSTAPRPLMRTLDDDGIAYDDKLEALLKELEVSDELVSISPENSLEQYVTEKADTKLPEKEETQPIIVEIEKSEEKTPENRPEGDLRALQEEEKIEEPSPDEFKLSFTKIASAEPVQRENIPKLHKKRRKSKRTKLSKTNEDTSIENKKKKKKKKKKELISTVKRSGAKVSTLFLSFSMVT